MNISDRLEQFASITEEWIENTSTPTRVLLGLGGAAVMAAGIELGSEGHKLAGMLVEDFGFVGVALGVAPRVLKFFGIE